MTTESQYWSMVLADLGAPQTPTSVSVLTAWSRGEKPAGDWSQWWNPLNTTQPATGATSVNSVGVKRYTSAAEGAAATAATIENGYYPALLQAFDSGAPLSSFQSSKVVGEVQNTWGTKLYGSLVKSPNNAAPRSPASGSGSSGGGIDLNPLDWLGAGVGAVGGAAGTAAGDFAGGVLSGVMSALGGILSGVVSGGASVLVPLATALIITLILIGPRGTSNATSTVVNLAGNALNPNPEPAAPDGLMDDDEAREYAQELRAWKQEERRRNSAQPGAWALNGTYQAAKRARSASRAGGASSGLAGAAEDAAAVAA